jgi:hypothetical protein
MIPETIRRASRRRDAATAGLHSGIRITTTSESAPTSSSSGWSIRAWVRPNPDEVQRAAKLLVEARMPLLIVGDELHNAKAEAKAVKLAELLGMPVTQVRQLYANFPETHPLWVGYVPAGTLNSLTWPRNADVIINVGNKFQHNSPAPIVPRGPKFIDMRIDFASMGNVMLTECRWSPTSGGLDDLIAAVEQSMTPSIRQKAQERALEVRRVSERNRTLRALVVDNPEWNASPIIADRVTWEIAKFADPTPSSCTRPARWPCTASSSIRSADASCFLLRRHLGSGVGTSAGEARPAEPAGHLPRRRRFVRVRPDRAVEHGAARLPVIVVVYNNHAYSGPHSRVIANVPSGRMVQTGNSTTTISAVRTWTWPRSPGASAWRARWYNPRNCARPWRAHAGTRSKASRICSTCRWRAGAWLGREAVDPPIQVAELRQKKV